MQSYFSADGLRAVLVLFLTIGQAVMAAWPIIKHWPETIGTRSAKLENPVVPIAWSFAIWGPIFMLCFGFAVWQLLPSNLADPLSREIGWLAVAMFAVNIIWEAYVPKKDLDAVSVGIILIELALLLAILFRISHSAPLDSTRFWLVYAPFQLFAGWISTAAFVNTASFLQKMGVNIDSRLSFVFILAAAALGAGIAWTTGGWLYAVAVAWGLFGVAIANAFRLPNTVIATLAASLVPVVLAAPVLSNIR